MRRTIGEVQQDAPSLNAVLDPGGWFISRCTSRYASECRVCSSSLYLQASSSHALSLKSARLGFRFWERLGNVYSADHFMADLRSAKLLTEVLAAQTIRAGRISHTWTPYGQRRRCPA